MADVTDAINPGWVTNKKGMCFSDNFQRILEFYLFSTPCDLTSSSSRGMAGRNWGAKPWSKTKLRSYLLHVGGFTVGQNYCKATKGSKKNGTQSNMSDKLATCQLNGVFQTLRENRIVFLSSDKYAEFIDVFFYIRCAFAHGRFIITEGEEEPVYIMEAAIMPKDKKETRCKITARMVIKESTLIHWADVIDSGRSALDSFKVSEEQQIKDEIIDLIFDEQHLTKEQIIKQLYASHSSVFTKKDIREAFDALKKEERIVFSKKRGVWIIND